MIRRIEKSQEVAAAMPIKLKHDALYQGIKRDLKKTANLATNGIPKAADQMDYLLELVGRVKRASGYLSELSAQFKDASFRAQEIATRIANTQAQVDTVKEILKTQIGLTYKDARRVADRCISSTEIRRAVFERDGWR
jgi:hypothetical protein